MSMPPLKHFWIDTSASLSSSPGHVACGAREGAGVRTSRPSEVTCYDCQQLLAARRASSAPGAAFGAGGGAWASPGVRQGRR